MFTAVAWMVSSSGCGAKNSTPGSSVDANVDAAAVASATPPEVEAGGIVPLVKLMKGGSTKAKERKTNMRQ